MYNCFIVPLWHGLLFLDILTDIMWNGLSLLGRVPLAGTPWEVGLRSGLKWLRFISVVFKLWQLYL